MDSSLEPLRTCVRRARRNTLILAGLGLGMAALFAFAPADRDDRTPKLVLAAVTAAAAIVLGRSGLRPIDQDPVLRALADGGRTVVWIYTERVSRFGNSSTYYRSCLRLGLADGTRLVVDVPKNRDRELLQLASDRVPHAAVGYDPELNRRFATSPASLRRG